MLRAYKKTYSNEYETMLLQNGIEEFTKQLLIIPLLNGHLLTDISLTSGSVNNVAHKLGRKPQGWIITRLDTNTNVWETTTSTTTDFLALNTGSNSIISLWVF